MSKQQQTLMRFDPATGWSNPYPSHAEQWREFNGKDAWLFNPWSGERRSAGDVGTDPFGLLILPPGEPVYVAGAKAWKPPPFPATPTEREWLDRRAGNPSVPGTVTEHGVTMSATVSERIKNGLPPDYTEEEFRAYSAIVFAREQVARGVTACHGETFSRAATDGSEPSSTPA